MPLNNYTSPIKDLIQFLVVLEEYLQNYYLKNCLNFSLEAPINSNAIGL